MAMNPEVKAAWLEALRSGEYEQGKEFLCRVLFGKKRYCCLGVLTEVVNDKFLKIGNKLSVENIKNDHLEFNGDFEILPLTVMRVSGLSTRIPSVRIPEFKSNSVVENTHALRLSHLNDVENFNFNQLADLIEEQL